jgi:hypothetical protein
VIPKGLPFPVEVVVSVTREKVKVRRAVYWLALSSVTKVMSSSCSHLSPVK